MLDIQTLRGCVEGEGDQRAIAGAGLARVLERRSHQRAAYAVALVRRIDEQLRQEPEIVIHPAKGESDDFPVGFGNPETVGIVLQREQLKLRGPDACYRSKP